MAKIGIEINIDVTQIDKARLYPGKKGTYLTLTGFVNLDEKDQYDNNGFVTQKKNKDEPKDMKMPILGNSRVFWSDMQGAPQAAPQQQSYQQQGQAPQQQAPQAQAQPGGFDDFDDDIPF